MSRFRRPEKQLSEWEEWSLPQASTSAPGQRHLNGWSELEGPLNTDYGLASGGQQETPPIRGPFAVSSNYAPPSNSLESQWDADSAAAFWAFPEPEAPSGGHLESPHQNLDRGNSDQSDSRASYYGGRREDDDDRRSVASYRTARATAQCGLNEASDQLSELQLQQEGIELFQEGALPEEYEEWHKLCPDAAREALDKKEVQRQSVIFEVIKSERDYVLDLQMIEQIFVVGLLSANPPIIAPAEELEDFIKAVFSNISDVERIHEDLLASLFRRQRSEHPVVTSVSDLVLDASFGFQEPYEIYIKNYPIAEGRHRKELKCNQDYAKFIAKCSQDTRIKKRDLISLLSRPVTRLPRLSLILEHCLKLTPPGHQDLEGIPVILGVLEGLVKSTQPGIAAAESKVKVRNLIESLVFERGELIDLDPSDENRSMIYQGILSRRDVKGWDLDKYGWADITVSLLDHYLIMTHPEIRSGVTRNVVLSRPIPLEFLRLSTFNLPAENRKVDDDGRVNTKKSILGIGKIFKDNSVPVYPFTIHHASLHSKRRYTLYASSEGNRRKWHDAFEEAIIIRRTQQDANRLFVLEGISETFFRSITSLVPATSPLRKSTSHFTGRITTAARFSIGGRSCLVTGCELGIYMSYAGPGRKFRKVIDLANPVALAALEKQGQLLVVHGGGLLAFPLDDITKAMDIGRPVQNTILKRLDNGDGAVTLLQVGMLNDRLVICYSQKGFRQQIIHTLEPVGGQIEEPTTPTPAAAVRSSLTYRRYGTPFYVPKDVYTLTVLKRTITVAADHSLVVVDPTAAPTSRRVLTVPDFTGCVGTGSAEALTGLKNRAQGATPLGVVWASDAERLVIYDTFGTYVSKFGYPTRNRTYVRWETKVSSWALRGPHVLLFSYHGWIEVRHISTGKLVQVEEAPEVRMLQVAEPNNGALLLAIRGKDDKEGLADRLVEMLETSPLEIPGSPGASNDPQWGERSI